MKSPKSPPIMIHIRLGMVLALFFAAHAHADMNPHRLPPAVQVVLLKINPLLQKKEYSRALETLLAFQARGGPLPKDGQAGSKTFHHPEVCFAIGNCHLLLEQYDSAIPAYQQAVSRDTAHTFAWLNLAKANYETNRLPDAAHCFIEGYESSETDKNPEYLYNAGAVYLMAGKHLQSIGVFERLFKAHPSTVKPEWKENMVHALLGANQPRRALPYIKELAQRYTGEKQIQWQEILLYQYIELGMMGEARSYARWLTQMAPEIAKWWKALTHVELNAGRYEEALLSLTVYSFIAQLSVQEKELLADLNLQLGIPVKAVPAYRSCLKDRPEKRLVKRLALAYQQIGKPEKALQCVKEFKSGSEDSDLLLLKADLLYELKQYNAAAKIYRQSTQTKGKHEGRAWLMAGYAAWQLNDIPAGKSAFSKAVNYPSQKKAAAAALKLLNKAVPQ